MGIESNDFHLFCRCKYTTFFKKAFLSWSFILIVNLGVDLFHCLASLSLSPSYPPPHVPFSPCTTPGPDDGNDDRVLPLHLHYSGNVPHLFKLFESFFYFFDE